jgi:hypothetical protein
MKICLYLVLCAWICSCSQLKNSQSQLPITLHFQCEKNDPFSVLFIENPLDSFSLVIDPINRRQLMKWQSLSEKGFLYSTKKTSRLILCNQYGCQEFTGRKMQKQLENLPLFSNEVTRIRSHVEWSKTFKLDTKEIPESFPHFLRRWNYRSLMGGFFHGTAFPLMFSVPFCKGSKVELKCSSVEIAQEEDFYIPSTQSFGDSVKPFSRTNEGSFFGLIRDKNLKLRLAYARIDVFTGRADLDENYINSNGTKDVELNLQNPDTTFYTNCDGRFNLYLKAGQYYNLKFSARGYENRLVEFDCTQMKVEDNFDINMDVSLVPILVNSKRDVHTNAKLCFRYDPLTRELIYYSE